MREKTPTKKEDPVALADAIKRGMGRKVLEDYRRLKHRQHRGNAYHEK